ncbi:MAG: radical SAM protein [Candidatus Latescibacteria bacterium]|jgi:sulfatase maturation enzyme AslB (radical SAM superfamily)|nr:hypothetical protein [Gemmatimonadaceae bacterium]MDP6015550.1 radical SAM protein [Candidatus Latescibacterota bacterium]MDP7448354.1 radical SAM protein [Candidatus Latescibacterota bacterium]HJP30626.1 radical SAM protein [Candidatus Latescibacterota bacterium]
MPDLSAYHPTHRARLEALLQTPAWQAAITNGFVDEVREQRLPPGSTRDFVATVVDQLTTCNEEGVRRRIAAGCRDRDGLVAEMSRWPDDLAGMTPLLSFLGLTLTYGCNFDPRCAYCTQSWQEPAVDLPGWKRIVDEATRNNEGQGPYVYITGGEVLTLEEAIWGDDGIVAFASRRGAAVNINTNASLITPEIALRLIKVGTSKLHISMDTPDAAVQDELWGEAGRRDRVLEGIGHLQLARDLVGVDGPGIHMNCVLNRHNLDRVGELFGFLCERKKRVPKNHPQFLDLLPHMIPVGGDANVDLRPTAADFERFHDVVWEEVRRQWDRYQSEAGIEAEDRGPLSGPFRNPFERVDQGSDLQTYARHAADGHYGRTALSRRCYVAPTQASVTPDGLQYRCGAHAVRRTQSIGSTAGLGIMDNIRAGLDGGHELPRAEVCDSCALATVYINQSAENKLEERVEALLKETESEVARP